MAKINAGVTLMQDFCRAESDVFSEYIDYIDREEAQRNTVLSKFNLFNDYVGNPYKGSHLFTGNRDYLSLSEKQDLKESFQIAQANESVMWQTVISFDNAWLEKNGVYDADKRILDERKIYEVTRHAMGKLLESEHLNSAVWSAGIHYNTDNLHVHIAIVEPYPMRELMMYNGNLEVRGKMKLSNLKACKSVIVNELMQSKEMNQKINFIIRKDIVEKLKERELSNDPELQDKFLALSQRLPRYGALNYNNRETAPIRKQVDEISKLFLDRYCPEKYKELVEIIERQSHLYAEAYGGGSENVYKEDKIYELTWRLGNAILKSAKEYVRNIERKTEQVAKSENAFRIERLSGREEQKIITEVESNAMKEKEEIDPTDYYEEIQEEGGSPFKIHVQDEKELPKEYKEAEAFWGKQNMSAEAVQNKEIPETLYNDYEQYGKWFGTYKEMRADINKILRKGEGVQEEKVEEFIREAEENPFMKAQLGEMCLRGKILGVDLEKAEMYFRDALDIFEIDVEHIEVKEKKFDFKSYLQYQVGKQYVCGWGTEYDPEVAAEWFEKSGTGYASFVLGNLYYEGEGVEQNYETAFRCYQKAGDNPFASLKIAQMYENGGGTEKNSSECEKYYKKAFGEFRAAEEKNPEDIFEYQLGKMLYYGTGCERDVTESIAYLEQSVKQKNVPSTLLLSRIYMEYGMVEKMPDMISILEELAEQGQNEAAQYTLGNVYTNDWEFYDLGKGIEQYEKAAAQGNQYAQYRLGKLYTDPELGVYDMREGVLHLESAVAQGNENAKYHLGKVYLDKNNSFHSPEKGMKCMRELAETGNEFAQFKLGIEYIKGENVERNLFEAREWLGKSAEQGNEAAKSISENLVSGRAQTPGKLNPMNAFDKALMELRKSMYKAQEETMKNLMIYEQELQEEFEMQQNIYI